MWGGGPVRLFTVHEPPDPPADRIDRAERLVFLKDGFSWAAFLLGPFWLAVSGEWMGLALYCAFAYATAGALTLAGAGPEWISLSVLAINLLLGFEASSIRRWSLARAGWQEIGSVSGHSAAECERRFFESWLPSQPILGTREAGGGSGPAGASTVRGARPVSKAGWRGLLGAKT
jgi:hypothetical protein